MPDPTPTPTPTAAPAADAADKLSHLLQSPEALAILQAAEQRAAALINALPSGDLLKVAPTGTPGWKTSEFWSLVVFLLLVLATMVAGKVPPQYGVIAQAVVTGLYQISRGLTKHGTGN